MPGSGAAGYEFYQAQKRAFVKGARRELASVAELLARHVSWWRRERVGDAKAIQANEAVMRWLASVVRGDVTNQHAIAQWACSLTASFDYLDVLLLSTNGSVCVSSRVDDRIGAYAYSSLRKVLASGEMCVSDLHRAEVVSYVHMDILIPVRDPDDRPAHVGGRPDAACRSLPAAVSIDPIPARRQHDRGDAAGTARR